MINKWIKRLGVIAVFVAHSVVAQETNTSPTFSLTITPPANSFFVSESSNEFEVNISNFDMFTNVAVTGYFGTNITGFAGDTNGVFTATMTAPAVTFQTDYPLNLLVTGDDIAITNAPADSTNDYTVSTNVPSLYTIVPPPENDDFIDAFKIPGIGGLTDGVNHFASTETAEPSHAQISEAGASLWWNWSSPVETDVLVDLAGTDFDGIVAVYTGSTVNKLRSVAASAEDVVNNIPANVQFHATAGTTYRIAVASKTQPGTVFPPLRGDDDDGSGPVLGPDTGGDTGNIRLRVAPGSTPDTRPPTIQIDGNNRNLLVDYPEVLLTGTARDLVGDTGIQEIQLRINGADGGTNVFASFFESGPNTVVWNGRIVLPAGTNVVEALAIDYAGNISLPDQIVVRYINPTNDYFSLSANLPGTGGRVTAETDRATLEEDEPVHAGNDGGHSIWYHWRAPADGQLTLTTSGSSFDTLLAIYQGTSIDQLVELASNDDEFAGISSSWVVQNVVSNEVYQIAVDGFGGNSGLASLQYIFDSNTPEEFFNVMIHASAGGTVSPQSGAFPLFSRLALTAIPDKNFRFLSWQGDINSTENPLNLTVTGNIELTPHFVATEFTDDFETGDLEKLPWENPGPQTWMVEENTEEDNESRSVSGGRFRARSSSASHNSTRKLSLKLATDAGTASFDVQVSCEKDWDYLDFYLNGQILQRWSGEVSWTNFQFPVPAGLNQFEWVYVKDGSFSEGDDAAYIDNFYAPPRPPAPGSGGTLLINYFPEGAQITLEGTPGVNYFIEASENLRDWQTIEVKQSVSGVIHILDEQAPGMKARYYRARPE